MIDMRIAEGEWRSRCAAGSWFLEGQVHGLHGQQKHLQRPYRSFQSHPAPASSSGAPLGPGPEATPPRYHPSTPAPPALLTHHLSASILLQRTITLKLQTPLPPQHNHLTYSTTTLHTTTRLHGFLTITSLASRISQT